ncbi:MAG: acyltransferase family protein, partial [Actinomycetes bacterium]
MEVQPRDRYLDLLRGASIVAVVVGHWLVADLVYTGGQLELRSSLAEVPAMWPLTWVFQVIPVFFFVAGAVNGPSWQRSLDREDGYAAFVTRRVHRVLI